MPRMSKKRKHELSFYLEPACRFAYVEQALVVYFMKVCPHKAPAGSGYK